MTNSLALQASRQLCRDAILNVAEILSTCFAQDSKVLICGNGGSAADAQHIQEVQIFVIHLLCELVEERLMSVWGGGNWGIRTRGQGGIYSPQVDRNSPLPSQSPCKNF